MWKLLARGHNFHATQHTYFVDAMRMSRLFHSDVHNWSHWLSMSNSCSTQSQNRINSCLHHLLSLYDQNTWPPQVVGTRWCCSSRSPVPCWRLDRSAETQRCLVPCLKRECRWVKAVVMEEGLWKQNEVHNIIMSFGHNTAWIAWLCVKDSHASLTGSRKLFYSWGSTPYTWLGHYYKLNYY